MNHNRQTLTTPGPDPQPQGLLRVNPTCGPPQSKPGRSLPLPMKRPDEVLTTPRRALPSKGAESYARPPEV